MANTNEDGSSSLDDVRERTGMMEGARDLSLDIEHEEPAASDPTKNAIVDKLKQKADPTPEAKPEPKPKLEGEEPEGEESEDDEEEGEEVAEEKVEKKESNPNPPAKKKGSSPIKTAFKIIGEQGKATAEQGKQISELAQAVKAIAEALKPKETPVTKADVVEELAKKLAEQGQDPDTVKAIIKAAKESTIQELRDAGLISEKKQELDPEDREAINDLKAEQTDQRETQSFDNEWNALMPALKQRYPNASESVLRQAHDEMWNIAVSEDGGVVLKKAKVNETGKILETGKIKPYPLDFLLHKFAPKFDAILKVAKGPKSSEGGSKGMETGHENDGEEGNLEMALDDQNPETYLKMQKDKIKNSGSQDVRLMG